MKDIAQIPFGEDGDLMAKEEQSVDAPKPPKKKRRDTPVIFIALLTVAATAALAFFVVRIVKNFYDKGRAEEIYNEAADFFEREVLADVSPSKEYTEVPTVYDRIKDGAPAETPGTGISADLAAVRAKISSLKQINPDVVGWIKVEGTKINYPLMKSSAGDDSYYLDHAYTGEYNSLGSIYMIYSCDEVLDRNYNTLIFGHNIVTGAMFHDVVKFFDADFFDSATLRIYTLDGEYIYKAFSVYETKSDYNYIETSFGSSSEFLRFASEVKSNSSVPSDIVISEGDTIITLSTCTATSGITDGRYALHAKLVEKRT